MIHQDILDYVSRFLLTQNAKCLGPRGNCRCQQGTLRCAAASMAIESDVTRWTSPHEIISLNCIYKTDIRYLRRMLLVLNLIHIHDNIPIDSWEQSLINVALKHGLQPFGKCDIPGGRGKQNPLALWYTDPLRRKELQEIHSRAGTSHLLADYLKAWPVNA